MDHDFWADHVMHLIGATPDGDYSHFLDQLANSGADISGLSAEDINNLFAHVQHAQHQQVKFGDEASDLQNKIDWEIYNAKRDAQAAIDSALGW